MQTHAAQNMLTHAEEEWRQKKDRLRRKEK